MIQHGGGAADKFGGGGGGGAGVGLLFQEGRHTNRVARAPLDLGLMAGVQQAPGILRILPDAQSVVHTQCLAGMLDCSLGQ